MKFICLVLSFILLACSGRKDTLRFNLVSESLELDWNRVSESSSVILIDNVMEGLTSYADSLHSQSSGLLRPSPALAASWSISDGGKTYTFHLRENAEWSDGVKLRAQHFVDSWERLLSPKLRAETAYQLFDVFGAEEYNSGKISDFSKVGVKAIDDFTLEVKLKMPAPYFLHLLTTVNTFPIRKDLIEKYGSQWTKLDHYVTLGAYNIVDWSPGEKFELKANPKYYGNSPAINRVQLKIVQEPATALALFQSGELDILPRELPAAYRDYWSKLSGFHTGPKLSVSYLAFNVRRAPFNKKENRQIFARAIARDELAGFHGGAYVPLRSWIPPGLIAHNDLLGIIEMPDISLPFRSLRLRYSASDAWNLTFQTIQKRLRKNGTQLQLEPRDWRDYQSFLSRLAEKKSIRQEDIPNILHLGWVADFPDPHTFMNVFTSFSESNTTGWKSEKYDRLIHEAVSTENEARRIALYDEAQRILLEEEAVIVPLFYGNHQALIHERVKAGGLNALDRWYFKNLRLNY